MIFCKKNQTKQNKTKNPKGFTATLLNSIELVAKTLNIGEEDGSWCIYNVPSEEFF